jgi:hypothetical protein
MNRLPRIATAYVVLSLVLGGLALLQGFPQRPTTWLGWASLFALVLPVTVAGEFVGELLFRNRMSRAVEQRTQQRSFSWLRIAYVLFLFLPLFAGITALGMWLSSGA